MNLIGRVKMTVSLLFIIRFLNPTVKLGKRKTGETRLDVYYSSTLCLGVGGNPFLIALTIISGLIVIGTCNNQLVPIYVIVPRTFDEDRRFLLTFVTL